MPNKVPPELIHQLRMIVHKFILRGVERVELVEEDGKQFIKLDSKRIGQSLQLCAGMDKSFTGFGLAEFAEVVLDLETQLNLKGFSRKEMLALAKFVPESKRTKWLEIW